MKRKLTILALLGALTGAAAIITASALIRQSAKGRTFSDVSTIPHRQTGLVLGCSQYLTDGRANLFFIYRVAAAAQLFKAGKIDYLIVSGDNHVVGYDEPTDMKLALVAKGVPAERIYCDYAGFRTLDSVVRAREIFNQSAITIISQKFHNRRAIYIARNKGIDAVGFNAAEVDSYNGFRTLLREQLAQVRTILDICLLKIRPKFLGPKIQIGNLP